MLSNLMLTTHSAIIYCDPRSVDEETGFLGFEKINQGHKMLNAGTNIGNQVILITQICP